MKKGFLILCLITVLLSLSASIFSQNPLTIEKIMLGDRFTGFSPENIRWSPSGKNLYFTWNREMEPLSSLYVIRTDKLIPERVSLEARKNLPSLNGTYNKNRSKMVYSKDGDLYVADIKTGGITQITSTLAIENNPVFNSSEDRIVYSVGNNLFSWEFGTGATAQLTDLRTGKERPADLQYSNDRDKWLHNNQMYLISVLSERKKTRELARKESEAMEPVRPKAIYMGQGMTRSVAFSPDFNYLTWQTFQPADDKRTIIPGYVTESGYTEDIQSRSKVGMPSYSSSSLNIYDIKGDTVYRVNTDDIPGLTDLPDYVSEYPVKKAEKSKKTEKPDKRGVRISELIWSDDAVFAIADIYSDDNKDRWIMLLDIKTGGLKLLDKQHDNAWIGGPGIGFGGSVGWLPDNRTIFFQSEETGYSHLYTLDVITGNKKALTSGNYEIYDLSISNDKKTWYFISNEGDNGVRELYKMAVKDGTKTRLTSIEGGVEAVISPDERYFALRVSHSNKPWELYLLENKEKALPVKITESATAEFTSYSWRVPEFIKFRASDGTMVPARLYKNDNPVKNGPAVIFVHGAGYLQNAHKWWSSYSREYMFHNFLVERGYTVLDIDYRGSAGYGRDWRTAIYRYMGGKDLDDQVDGAKYLVEQLQVNPEKIGIYGGSYGGFMTLMAMFTKPGTFAAGAALRSVTDWAHYNHGYTSGILNTPAADSIAYVKSSPIYYAEGLKGALLICHGMIDDNVHFQDVVRLSQKLIELGKDNWEMAVYPLERHGFVEPSSWTDEYKRIFKLFENNLK
jgi:dipeptidyl aminopeptidase/acylaminoacyl peptidase